MSIKRKVRKVVNDIIEDIRQKVYYLELLSKDTKYYIQQVRLEIEEEVNKIEHQKELLKKILREKDIFKLSAEMYADVESYIFDNAENYLKTKKHPSKKSAELVKELKAIAKMDKAKYREIKYKLDILLNEFPYLAPYIEDNTGEALMSLVGNDLQDVERNYDRVCDFISQEEYDRLNVIERNQLALDRYKKRPKSNWIAGVEYEMYIEYWYREKLGCDTIAHGSLKGLEDLGRDVIAKQYNNGKQITYIIQCKRYSLDKRIHENTICQLYGTAIEYELSNKELFGEIVPVLYSTTDLSPMAEKFAERLGVKTYKTPIKDYPMIKCNIGKNGEKIYHLPFDQQYYNVIIDKPGEFYAWTVEDAEKLGFRRAKKYIFNKV